MNVDVEKKHKLDHINTVPAVVDTFLKTPCQHRFHKKCLKDWMK